MEIKKDTGLRLKEGDGWLEFDVVVQPRSNKDQVVGLMEGRLKVRLTAHPVKGKANDALRDLLATLLKVPKGHVEIVKGLMSRRKRIRIKGIGLEELFLVLRSL